jgi:hypothetical protein
MEIGAGRPFWRPRLVEANFAGYSIALPEAGKHMTFVPDLSESTMVCAGNHVRAIGWLSKDHDYATGNSTIEFASRLAEICDDWSVCAKELGFGFLMGWHTCEFCGRFRATGNIGVPAGDLLYVAPEMIHHYVTIHRYSPPPEFVDAVMACPAPRTSEYQQLALPFRDLQLALKSTSLAPIPAGDAGH